MTFTSVPRKSIISFNKQNGQMERVMHKLDDTIWLSCLTEQTWHKKMESYFTTVNVWQETQNYPYQKFDLIICSCHSFGCIVQTHHQQYQLMSSLCLTQH